MKIKLDLTEREMELLRNSTSELGTTDRDCISLQLKIISSIFDAKYPKENLEDLDIRPCADKIKAWPEFQDRFKDHHTEHCCAEHGCQYGDILCPVWLGNKPQTFCCEQCIDDKIPQITVEEFDRRRKTANELC